VGQALAAGPGLDADGDGGGADALEAGVDAQDVANLDGRNEGHGLDRNGDDTAAGAFDGGDGAGYVHLAHDPAAEDVACRIGVGGHGQGADGEGAHGFAWSLHDQGPFTG